MHEENVARKISQLSQLFLPQQYNFSQFAAFSSHNLYSKGSDRSSPAYKPQSKYSDEDRYTIAKYAKDNGASQAAKFFNNKYPTINESTVWTFVKKYDENMKVAKACGSSPDRKLKTLMCGRPLMVGPIINEIVRKFMVSLL